MFLPKALDVNKNDGFENDNGTDNNTHHSEPSSPIVARILNELALVKAGEHNILTFQEMAILKEIRSRHCCDLLSKRNMSVLLIIYVESQDEVISHLRKVGGISINKYIGDGSLIIESDDAYSVMTSQEHDFHSYLQSIQDNARKKGKKGLAIILDISSLLLMSAAEELLKFESEILSDKNRAHLNFASFLCCYNGLLFDKIERTNRDAILNNHQRKLCGVATSTS